MATSSASNPVSPVKPVMEVLAGRRQERPPVWVMRQAGRYLPEYRETRKAAGSFLDLCFTPELAVEVTLQPIRRFGFDASIMFSDILVVPYAFGQKVWFVEGEGPRLEPIVDATQIAGTIDLDRLKAVFEILRTLRRELPATTTLLGFCGAPWTLAGYMIVGRGGKAKEDVRGVAYTRPEFMRALLDLLVQGSIDYLVAQFRAGADAVQIFESFAGEIPPALFESLCLDPIRRIIAGVRVQVPNAPVIVFARGASLPNQLRLARESGAHAVGIDWGMTLPEAAQVQALKPVQGNLDPLALVAGGRGTGGRCAGCAGGARAGSADLQSRPRHCAANAGGPCGADDRTRPERVGADHA